MKVIIHLLQAIPSKSENDRILKKIRPSLLAIYHNSLPEIKYAVLQNIYILIYLYPDLLKEDVHVIFTIFFSGIFLQLWRSSLPKATKTENHCFPGRWNNNREDSGGIERVNLTCKSSYATSVDLVIIKESLKCIGKCALKLPESASLCVKVLLDLLKSEVKFRNKNRRNL